MADEHAGEGLMLGAESHANTDLASALRDGISDHAVDTDDAQQERHAAGDAEHDQSEGSAGHGALVEKVQRVDVGEGKIWIHGPYRLADIVQKAFRTSAGSADGKNHIAENKRVLAFETIHHKRPINGRCGRLADTIIINIADDADDFPPIVFGADADAFADRGRRVMPILASHVFRDHGDGNFLVRVVPGDLTACHQRCAQSPEISGRDKLEAAERRKLAFGISAALNEKHIGPALAGHGDLGADSDGSYTGNRGDLVQDLLIDADRFLLLFHLRTGNRNAEGLQRGRADESGIDIGEGAEGPNHQAGTDQQDKSEGNLHDDEDAARAMLLLALTESAAALADAGAETNSGVLEDGNGSKQD